MSLLDYLRKTGPNGAVAGCLRRLYDAEAKHTRDPGETAPSLGSFANSYRMQGEQIVAVDYYWRLNDGFYGQWCIMYLAFRDLATFDVTDVRRLVPGRYRWLATALVLTDGHSGHVPLALQELGASHIGCKITVLFRPIQCCNCYLLQLGSFKTSEAEQGMDMGPATAVIALRAVFFRLILKFQSSEEVGPQEIQVACCQAGVVSKLCPCWCCGQQESHGRSGTWCKLNAWIPRPAASFSHTTVSASRRGGMYDKASCAGMAPESNKHQGNRVAAPNRRVRAAMVGLLAGRDDLLDRGREAGQEPSSRHF